MSDPKGCSKFIWLGIIQILWLAFIDVLGSSSIFKLFGSLFFLVICDQNFQSWVISEERYFSCYGKCSWLSVMQVQNWVQFKIRSIFLNACSRVSLVILIFGRASDFANESDGCMFVTGQGHVIYIVFFCWYFGDGISSISMYMVLVMTRFIVMFSGSVLWIGVCWVFCKSGAGGFVPEMGTWFHIWPDMQGSNGKVVEVQQVWWIRRFVDSGW